MIVYERASSSIYVKGTFYVLEKKKTALKWIIFFISRAQIRCIELIYKVF